MRREKSPSRLFCLVQQVRGRGACPLAAIGHGAPLDKAYTIHLHGSGWRAAVLLRLIADRMRQRPGVLHHLGQVADVDEPA